MQLVDDFWKKCSFCLKLNWRRKVSVESLHACIGFIRTWSVVLLYSAVQNVGADRNLVRL